MKAGLAAGTMAERMTVCMVECRRMQAGKLSTSAFVLDKLKHHDMPNILGVAPFGIRLSSPSPPSSFRPSPNPFIHTPMQDNAPPRGETRTLDRSSASPSFSTSRWKGARVMGSNVRTCWYTAGHRNRGPLECTHHDHEGVPVRDTASAVINRASIPCLTTTGPFPNSRRARPFSPPPLIVVRQRPAIVFRHVAQISIAPPDHGI
ncbi:hypothetical protein EDB81DRAFT_489540 [Dactylonectria macrodidyma]|uniref:Uncharacterized protein n=1 Tax=Dactylonectria macrodidyma TaxID=307937 RepID=A0A9P9EW26_9HYPO|nr:hypothetical protein EDB81DRAFT_489540 [Dactylonectria macrodidyma]